MAILAAWIYAALALVVGIFQTCLAAGLPWGHLSNGGRWPGRLPRGMRVASAGFAALWCVIAWVVLRHAGAIPQAGIAVGDGVKAAQSAGAGGLAFWLVAGLTVLTTIANLITPSKPERLLWGPVLVVMCLCLAVIIATR